MDKEITIVTLFGGRFHLLEPYLYSFDNLDYPKEKLSVIWLTNFDNESFKQILELEAEKRKKDYKDFKVVFVSDIPTSPMVVEEGKGGEEHANIIAQLYNRAFKLISTELFFCLEDDTTIPPFTLNKLLTHLVDPKVAYACGGIFDRHSPGLFCWTLKKIKRIAQHPNHGMTALEDYIGINLTKPWGVRNNVASTLALSLIRTGAVKLIHPTAPFRSKHPCSVSLVGCDMVLCLDLELRGFDRIVDFDVRSFHFDSKGKPH